MPRTSALQVSLALLGLVSILASPPSPALGRSLDSLETKRPVLSSQNASATPETSPSREPSPIVAAAEACSGGAQRDDGTAETGHGFVPSAKMGAYLQPVSRQDLKGSQLGEACVCFLKTRGDQEIDFEVIAVASVNGRPGEELFAVPAHTKGIVTSKAEAGPFVVVDLGDRPIPDGDFFLGARWNPKVENYLFVCADHSDGSDENPAFFMEDQKPVWAPVLGSRDPALRGHRSLLIRVTSEP